MIEGIVYVIEGIVLAMVIIPGGIILPMAAVAALVSTVLGVPKRRYGHEESGVTRADTRQEMNPDGSIHTLTHGRKEVQ